MPRNGFRLTIDLPWPHKSLSQNARTHWAAKAKQTALHRGWASIAAQAEMRKTSWPSGLEEASARATFIDPAKRRRDRVNHQAMLKAYYDGFEDAGVIVNDCGFIEHPARFEVGPKRMVRIEIEVVGTEWP